MLRAARGRSTMMLGAALGAYDAFSSTVRVAGSADGRNLVDDPSFVRLLAHYGQTLFTECGQTMSMMLAELYAATHEILRTHDGVTLPLSKIPRRDRRSEAWARATFARTYLNRVVGGPDEGELKRFEDASKRHGLGALLVRDIAELPLRFAVGDCAASPASGTLRVVRRSEDVIELVRRRGRCRPLPRLEVTFEGGERCSFVVNAHFVLQLHARTAACIQTIYQHRLSDDDQLDWLGRNMSDPYLLPAAFVNAKVRPRGTPAAFDILDGVFLCHLCSLIALCLAPGDGASIQPRTFGGGRIKIAYCAPGDVLVRAFEIALEHVREPGDVVNDYFGFVDLVLSELGAPPSVDVLERIRQNAERFAGLIGGSGTDEYNDFVRIRYEEGERAAAWCAERLRARELYDVIAAPAAMIQEGVVAGPLVVGPDFQIAIGSFGVHIGQVKAMLFATILAKLWDGTDLTCTELAGGPFWGSTIACSRHPKCFAKAGDHWVCAAAEWESALRQFGVPTSLIEGFAATARKDVAVWSSLADAYARLIADARDSRRVATSHHAAEQLGYNNTRLQSRLDELIRVASQQPPPVLIGLYPTSTFTALATPVGAGFLVLVEGGLLALSAQAAAIIAAFVPAASERGPLPPVIDTTTAREMLWSAVTSLVNGFPESRPAQLDLDEGRDAFATFLISNLVDFAIAHELAHVLLGHCDGLQRPSVQSPGTQPSPWYKSWQHEMEADRKAIELVKLRWNGRVREESQYLGAALFFELTEMVDAASRRAQPRDLMQDAFDQSWFTYPPAASRRSALIVGSQGSPVFADRFPMLDFMVDTMRSLRQEAPFGTPPHPPNSEHVDRLWEIASRCDAELLDSLMQAGKAVGGLTRLDFAPLQDFIRADRRRAQGAVALAASLYLHSGSASNQVGRYHLVILHTLYSAYHSASGEVATDDDFDDLLRACIPDFESLSAEFVKLVLPHMHAAEGDVL